MSSPQETDRARGALYGLAIGDALGMPTQMLSRPQIIRRWGPLLTGFEAAPPGHPIAAGLPAGAVTDDTEQAVLLARLLLAGGGGVAGVGGGGGGVAGVGVDPREWASALAAWERDMVARGSLDLLGPSTRRAIDAVLAGTPPEEAGVSGDTNGAAMRIAPVGIVVAAGNLTALADAVHSASLVTHNTSVALAGAAAVAAAVSFGISGGSDLAAVEVTELNGATGSTGMGGTAEVAIAAARLGAERGHWVAGADVAARIRWAVDLVAGLPAERAAELIYSLVGTSLATQESVPAAFAVLSAVPDDPWRACLLAASLGGDCDTIAAMTGAIAGARHGLAAFPAHAIAVIDAHGFALADLADALLARRRQGNRPPGKHP